MHFGLTHPENYMDYFLNKNYSYILYVKRLFLLFFFFEHDLFLGDLIY